MGMKPYEYILQPENINIFDKIEKRKCTEYPKINHYSDLQTAFFDFKNLNNSKQGCPTV